LTRFYIIDIIIIDGKWDYWFFLEGKPSLKVVCGKFIMGALNRRPNLGALSSCCKPGFQGANSEADPFWVGFRYMNKREVLPVKILSL
jgi:hypothetical protein